MAHTEKVRGQPKGAKRELWGNIGELLNHMSYNQFPYERLEPREGEPRLPNKL